MLVDNASYSVIKCPWKYFDEDIYNDKTKRFVITIDNEEAMILDYFINEENCYLLTVYVYEKYRNKNMFILGGHDMYEFLKETDLKNIKNLIYPNMDENIKILFNFDKRRYFSKFNIFAIDTTSQKIEEIYVSI